MCVTAGDLFNGAILRYLQTCFNFNVVIVDLPKNIVYYYYASLMFIGNMFFPSSYLQFIEDLPLYDDKTGDSWQPTEIPDETWNFQFNRQVLYLDQIHNFWELQNDIVLFLLNTIT